MTSERFRVKTSEVVSVLAMRYGLRWGVICAIPVVTSIVLGIVYDTRFFILALMVLMIFIPLVAAFLYFDHGLRPATALNTVEHSVRLDAECLTVTVFPPNRHLRASDTLDLEVLQREAETSGTLPREVHFPYAELSPYITGLSSLILPVGRKGLLLIPPSAFKAPDSLSRFAETLTARCASGLSLEAPQ